MLIILAAILASLILPATGVFIYRQGLRDGRATATPSAQLPPLWAAPRRAKGAPAPELARLNTIMQNIDAYDGTKKGQKGVSQ